MPLAPAPSPLARQMVQAAFEELGQTITAQDSRDFHKTTLQDVKQAALNIETQLASRLCLRNMRRLMPLFQGLEHYAKAMSVLCNGTPFLPWAWAPITLILRIACEHVEAFEQIMKGYSRIASALKRFEILDKAFSRDTEFQKTMAVFYADILQFHKHAYKFVRRNGWKLLFLTSWGRFQRRFDNILEDMERHEALIDLEANAHDIAEGRQLRQDIRLWREESLDRIRRLDEEHAAKQYKAIISWLKADESDQLAIFESISAEGSKHPGTCGWVLKTPKVSSWLRNRRETPMLWLQGSPGTGKSVLSAQLINYMKVAKMFVIHHFCTYSYPSSTSYEQILRSLLLQLLRKDGDLVAHVYNECVLEKKSPTLSILEHLLQVLLTSLSSEPCQTEHIWILLDGLDECDIDKQARAVSLLNQVASKASSSESTICKVLVSSRFTRILAKRLGKKQTLSLGDEKAALSEAIRQYASQRLQSLHHKFSQLDIGTDELREIECGVARKADGMFLYARLVLDYLSTNIFYSGEEVRTSINHLPDKLSDLYRRILTQILAHLDARSVDRIKCILGWVAFSKRPLKKLEFLSAVSFSAGDPNVTQLAPQYILDICEPLVEERADATLAFIHVSVKDFVQSPNSNLSIHEEEVLQQHAAATLACLISGLDVFNDGYPEHSKAFRVIKGIHGFHVYATQYWTEYLLSEASRHSGISSGTPVFRLARQLVNKLEGRAPSNVSIGESEPCHSDERLLLLEQHQTLQKYVKQSLDSTDTKRLEREIQNEQTDTPQPIDPPDSILAVLMGYQQCVRYILDQHDFPGVSAEDLELFKRQFRTSAFTCRLNSCPRATVGFESAQLLREHELSHICRLRCPFPSCQYPPFPSAQSLRSHERKVHQPNPAPRPIRRVKNLELKQPVLKRLKNTGPHDWKSTRPGETAWMTRQEMPATSMDTPGAQGNDLRTYPESLLIQSVLSSPPEPAALREGTGMLEHLVQMKEYSKDQVRRAQLRSGTTPRRDPAEQGSASNGGNGLLTRKLRYGEEPPPAALWMLSPREPSLPPPGEVAQRLPKPLAANKFARDSGPSPKATDDSQPSIAVRVEFEDEPYLRFPPNKLSSPDFVLFDDDAPSAQENNLTALPESLPPPPTGDKDQGDAMMDQGPDNQGYRLPYEFNPELDESHMQSNLNGRYEVLDEGTRIDLGYPRLDQMSKGGPWNPGRSALQWSTARFADMPMPNTIAVPDRMHSEMPQQKLPSRHPQNTYDMPPVNFPPAPPASLSMRRSKANFPSAPKSVDVAPAFLQRNPRQAAKDFEQRLQDMEATEWGAAGWFETKDWYNPSQLPG